MSFYQTGKETFDEVVDRYARSLVLRALHASGWSRAGAARALGVSRRRFYRLARRLRVNLEARRKT